MKRIKLLLAVITASLLGLSQSVFAVAETEPNNAWNQANVITLGATGTGTCTATGDIDWWRVNSTVDGKLTINFTSTGGFYLYCEVYDTLGAIGLSSGTFTSGSTVINVDGLAAGTYYIKFFAYDASQSPTYSFVPSWTTPAQTIDVEPNTTKAQAKTLALNGSVTGHVGYYYNNKRDTTDWWKVTTNKDGQLNYTLTSNNGQYVYAQLFDNDGVTYLVGAYTSGTATWSYNGLAVGTYYIKVFAYDPNNGYSPYNLSNTLTLPPCVIDAEPNGTAAQALTINLGDSLVGHVGYYYNHYRDTLDWYKVTTTLDGQLNYQISSLNGQYVYLQLYDNDGVTQLGGNYTAATVQYSTDGLAVGTYYLRIFAYDLNNGFIPYSLKLTQTLPSVTIDVEPNDNKTQAKTVNPNDSITGHVGYYYNHARDTFDYRKITITSNGRIDWTISSQNGSYIYAQLFDNNGTTYLGGNYTSGTTNYSVDGLAAGTYYFIIQSYSNTQFEPYYLKTSFTPTASDLEPNGTYATAAALTLNDSLNGNVSYYYNNTRDTTDWFKLTTNNDGQLNVKLYSLNGNYIYLTVYDNNGTTILYQSYSSSVVNYSRNDLGKGTYYIRVDAYSVNTFVRYALVNKLTSQLANDVENNDYAKTAAKTIGYKSKTGHINYYYNNRQDSADWFKVKLVLPGNLQTKVVKSKHTFDASYPDIIYKLYGDTSLAPLATNNMIGSTASYTFNHNGLAAGTYYIKLERSAATFGAYTLTTNYIDTATATVALSKSTVGTSGTCNTGTLTYFVTRGIPPYSVQLYLDGVATGAPVVTNDTAKFTGLAPGAYYATVKCSGALVSGTTSTIKGIVPVPKGNTASNITGTTAIVKWTSFACVDGFIVSYKKTADPTFISDTIASGAVKDTLKNLSLLTSYDYKVAAFVVYNGVKYISAYTAVKNFTTLAARFENTSTTETNTIELQSYPNPVLNDLYFILNNVSGNLEVSILNPLGQVVKSVQLSGNSSNTFSVDVSELPKAVYMIQVINGEQHYTSRFIKE